MSYNDYVQDKLRLLGWTDGRAPTALQVEGLSRALSKEIHEAQRTLIRILDRCEGVLRKRWLKMREDKRVKILRSAWNHMPTQHRPDLFCFHRPGSITSKDRYVSSFRYPHINLEDLSNLSNALLLMLNARARNAPHVFAHTDATAMMMDQVYPPFQGPVTPECVIYLFGQKDEASYGHLEYTGEKQDVESLQWELQFPCSTGILTMEKQRVILQFLISCCRLIMHDVKDKELTWGLPVQPQLSPPATYEGSIELVSAKTEATYGVTQNLNPSNLVSLAQTMRNAAEDHIWELREDPGYLADMMLELSEHDGDLLLGLKEDRRLKEKPKAWHANVASLTVQAYMEFVRWNQVCDRACAIADAWPAENMDITKALPEDLELACRELRYTLSCFTSWHVKQIEHYLPYSPALRSQYRLDEDKTVLLHKPKAGSVHWLFSTLASGSEFSKRNHTLIIDEIQRLLDSNLKERETIGEFLYSRFSSLAVVAHMWHALSTFYPWSARMWATQASFVSKAPWDKDPDAALFVKLKIKAPSLELACHVFPFDKMQYPISKAHTEANVRRLRQAEGHLRNYWNAVDAFCLKYSKGLDDLMSRHGSKPREPYRTPEWSAMTSTKPGAATRFSAGSVQEPIPAHQFSHQSDSLPRRFAALDIKEKVKTRGTPGEQDADLPRNNPEELVLEDTAKIKVSERALRVFLTLFPSRDPADRRLKELPWTEFLHAMSAIDCKIEPLTGSIWRLTPSNAPHPLSVHEFHRPGRASGLSLWMARKLGRRLTRHYEWTADTFVLED